MKRKIVRLKFLFVLLFCPAAVWAQDLVDLSQVGPQEVVGNIQDWSWTGHLRTQVNLVGDQKPSAKQGQVASEWGSVEFENLWKNDAEPFEVALAGQIGPGRDKNSNEPAFFWEELRFTWTHRPELSIGILQDPVYLFTREEWGESSLGSDFEPMLNRWGLIPTRDAGVQLAMGSSWGKWILQATNGEGWPQPEIGTRKDYELVWEQPFLLSASILKTQIFYRYGEYDSLAEKSEKHRYGLQVAYQSRDWTFGMSGAVFRDPVDAISKKTNFAESVDLTLRGGETNQGQGGEAYVLYRWGERPLNWRALLSASELQVDPKDRDKNLNSLVAGVGKTVASGMQVNLLYQSTGFGRTHSPLSEDRQRWFLAWVWGLERKPAL